jgi:uncharacterized glyoxalase superfamily protein PhnB
MPSLYPCLWYRDAHAAIAWLRSAFGFEPLMVVPGADGGIAHAELRLGTAVIMMGSLRKNDVLRMVSPQHAGGITQSIYIAVEDGLDAQYARAIDAGAEIVRPLADTNYGSREFTVADPDGHLWHFGTYVPSLPAD